MTALLLLLPYRRHAALDESQYLLAGQFPHMTAPCYDDAEGADVLAFFLQDNGIPNEESL